LTIDKDPTIDLKETFALIGTFSISNVNEELFIRHAQTITKYQTMLVEKQHSINQLEMEQKLETFKGVFEAFSHASIEMMQLSIIILLSLLILIFALYFYTLYILNIAHQELTRFRKTLENSDNIVVITDFHSNIKYVNQSFTNATGYTPEEALGKNPKILKSGRKTKEFYEELNKTIYSGNKWHGEFENIDKYGNLSYEKASITPVLNEKGEIIEFIAIKLNITDEVLSNAIVKEQQETLFAQQAKMATMGEMIGNIAHQWRQPLGVISTYASTIIWKNELDLITKSDLINDMNQILNTTTYLSETIDTFRNYLKEKKERKEVVLQDRIRLALKIVNTTLKDNHITLVDNVDYTNQILIATVIGELDQVIINIINNAKDVIVEKNIDDGKIFVELAKGDNFVLITIEDNGGGIANEILPNIFDEYFTTKESDKGTGLGLYMSYKIITESLGGKLTVENTQNGAKFSIELPLSE